MEYKVYCVLFFKRLLKAFIWTYLIGNRQSLGREEPTKGPCPHGQKQDQTYYIIDSPNKHKHFEIYSQSYP